MIAKSRSNVDSFIKAHAFSVLGIYNVEVKGFHDPDFPNLKVLTLFFLYNPWGTDIPKNMLLNKKDILDKKKLIKRAVLKIDKTTDNDGKFFIEYSIILRYFEKINIYERYENYKIISKRIDFLDSKATFEVNFTLSLDVNSTCFLFFNLHNINTNDPFFPQIQPYEIENLEITPKMANSTLYLEPQVGNNMIYKGMSFRNSGKSNYTLAFKLKKFNYDIIDHVFLNFYSPKNSLHISGLYVSKIDEICPENCNNNGKCNNFIRECVCFPKVFFFSKKVIII